MGIVFNNSVANILNVPGIASAPAASQPSVDAVAPGTIFIDTDNGLIYQSINGSWQQIGGGAAAQNLQSVLDTGNIAVDQNLQITDTVTGATGSILANGGSVSIEVADPGSVSRASLGIGFISVVHDLNNTGFNADYNGLGSFKSLDYEIEMNPQNACIRFNDMNSGNTDQLNFQLSPNSSNYTLPQRSGIIQLENINVVANVDLSTLDYEITEPGAYCITSVGTGEIDLTGYSTLDGTQILLLVQAHPFNIIAGGTIYGSNLVNADGLVTITFFDSNFYVS